MFQDEILSAFSTSSSLRCVKLKNNLYLMSRATTSALDIDIRLQNLNTNINI